MCVAVSATIAAVAKKILVCLLGDKKGRKALGYAIGITLFILLLPVIATYGLFGWMAKGETELLSPEMVYDNIPIEYREQIELYADELKKIEAVFSEKEMRKKQTSAAKMIYVSCLVGKETEERFYERLAECFTEEDVLTSISSAFGVSFSEEDRKQFEKLYGDTT